MDNLPWDIMIEILSRLPVKSILRCRCVCKFWLNLTKDSTLIERHLFWSSQAESNLSLILHSYVPIQFNYFQNRLLFIQDDGSSVYSSLNVNLSIPCLRNYQVVGSCNGLVCLFDPSVKIVNLVTNPCTGEYIEIPKPLRTREIPLGVIVGFGISATTNQYKVVEIVNYNSDSHNDELRSEIHTYTLGDGSWRHLGNAPFSIQSKDHSSLLVNGGLHWVSSGYDGPRLVDEIIAFDLENEEFKTIPHPDFESRRLNYTLGVLNGCLSATNNKFQEYVEVWTMNLYGVKESWTMKFKIVCSEIGLLIGSVRPLLIQKNGEVVMLYGGIALSYDPIKKKLGEFRIAGLPRSFKAFAHLGTLVSPTRLFDKSRASY